MTNWIISANPKLYNFNSSFKDYSFIDWRQRGSFQIGDIIYIYTSGKDRMVQHKCIVEAINLIYPNIRDDREYYSDPNEFLRQLQVNGKFMRLTLLEQVDNINLSFDNLKANGLKSKLQGPIKINGTLLDYVVSNFTESYQTEIFPELINDDDTLFEGIKKQVLVNKYERSSKARKECLKHNQPICAVCEMKFVDKYGEIGRDFIHIHHVIPIHKIGIKYEIDYKKDLIPVCPNCHAMLHRKINGKELTIDELKERLKSHS